jgi:hypothetical protein
MKGVEIPLSKCHVGLLWGGEQGEGPLIDVLEFQKTVYVKFKKEVIFYESISYWF